MSAARLAGVDVFTRPHADRVIIRWNAEASAPFSVRSVVNADMPRSLLELLTRDRIGELNHCFASTMGVHSGMSSFVRPTHRDWASMDTALASAANCSC
jgi:hypothetical protein